MFNNSRYELVGKLVNGRKGNLVDIGGRDRTLLCHLPKEGIKYLSADLSPGHDFIWNLELPLEPEDNSFDMVVALEVLEHVENIHSALQELIRIAKHKVFISLPNMSCLSLRLKFLATGRLSGKYSLLPEHQGDRHRWLTTFSECNDFVDQIARVKAKCRVDRHDISHAYSPLEKALALMPLSPNLRAYNMLYEITKNAA